MNEPARSAASPGVPLAAALIVLAGLVVYANSFQGVFVFDDTFAIVDNPTIRHLWPLKDVLFPASHAATVDGRPLLNLSFALNYAAGGLHVWGYHAVNLAVHLLAGLALFGIVRRTLLLPVYRERMAGASLLLALVVALMWVVHPLQTESVTYICQRAESLVGLVYLMTLYLAIRGFGSARPWAWQAGAVMTCMLGMVAKEVMVTAPLLVLIYDRVFVAGSFWQALRMRRVFYLAVMTSWGVLAALLVGNAGMSLGMVKALGLQLGGRGAAAVAGSSANWLNYALTQFGAVVHYLRLSLWPDSLTLDYGQEITTGFFGVLVPAMVVGLLLVGTVIALRRHHWAGFAGAWFFLILAPTTSVMPLPGQTMAEHRMYLPLAGVMVVVVMGVYAGWCWLLPRVVKDVKRQGVVGRAVPAAVTTTALLVMGGLTIARNLDYHTELSILQDTVLKRPLNQRVRHRLADLLAAQEKLDEAIHHYERLLQLKPHSAVVHSSLGVALARRGKSDEALLHFDEALKYAPNDAGVQNNWGLALLLQGKPGEAVSRFLAAVRADPLHADAHASLGDAYLALGKPHEAMTEYQTALRCNPKLDQAHYKLGNLLLADGDTAAAAEHYRAALVVNPNNAEGHYHLAHFLVARKAAEEGIKHYREAVRLRSDFPEALNNLAWVLATHQEARLRNGPEAVRLAQRASELAKPTNAQTLDTLAAAYAEAGKFALAIEAGRQALALAEAAGQKSLVDGIRDRLQLYQSGLTYRE